MSHGSPPGVATSLTVAYCAEPEFLVEEECGMKESQGLPRLLRLPDRENKDLLRAASLRFLFRMECMGFRPIPDHKRDTPASRSTPSPTDLVTSHKHLLKSEN